MYFFDNLDALIFFHLILVLLSNLILIILGFLSQSKYSMIGTFSVIIQILSLDIFISLIYIIIIFSSQSVNFHDFFFSQYNY